MSELVELLDGLVKVIAALGETSIRLNMTASSSGQRAMHPARDPPGQLGLAVFAAEVVVGSVAAVVGEAVVFCVVVGVVGGVVGVVGASAVTYSA